MSFYKPFQNRIPGQVGDLDKTGIITLLFKVPYEERDDEWKQEYFPNIADACLEAGVPQVIEGPDGYPYFHLKTPEIDTTFQGFSIKQLTEDFLFQEGVGLALNPSKEVPDWVFSYGDIVNYKAAGEFYSEPGKWQQFDPAVKTVSINPPAEVLPPEARTVLRRYLQDYKINTPKIALIKDREEHLQLMFEIPAGLFRHEDVRDDVGHSLSWFLPKHYTYQWTDPDKAIDWFEI